jgi:biopolymer transport protein ExbD
MQFPRATRPTPEFNLTPLIDILFIVLMFLVLTATFRESTFLRLTLPEARTGERQDTTPDVLTIIIDAGDEIRVNDAVVTLDDLRPTLEAMARTDGEVVLAADRLASHGAVIGVMDLARQAGVDHLDIQTMDAPSP